MYFFDPAAHPAVERRPGIHIRAASGERLTLSHVSFEPNAAFPAHQHPAEQVSVVLSGSLTLTIGGETRELRPGDSCLIPGNVPHSGQAGPEGAHIVDVFSPVREDYK